MERRKSVSGITGISKPFDFLLPLVLSRIILEDEISLLL